MFDLLPNFWMPVLPVTEIKDVPVATELAGEKLVLFRNSENQIGAMLDSCPHRGAALSLGHVTSKGCLQCPYHGWQFDHQGACTHVPLNNPAEIRLSKLSAVSLPTQIRAGLVWVFTGQGNPPALQLPDSLMRSPESYIIHHEIWNAHWTRVVENSMDYVHLPFVHQDSFGGRIGQPAIEAGSFAQFQIEKTSYGMQVLNYYHNLESRFVFEWHQPNLVILKFDEMGLPIRLHSFAVPINQHQTRFLLVSQLLAPYAIAIVNDFTKVLAEDRRVIESQKGAIPFATGECNVPSDQATLLFRRWYHHELYRSAKLESESELILS